MAHTRLTPNLIRAIFVSTDPARALADRYGLHIRAIYRIQSRDTHARYTTDLTRPAPPPRPVRVKPAQRKPHLKPEQITSIFVSTDPAPELASQFGVSTFTIRAIQHRAAHSKITADLPDVVRVRRRGPVPKPKLKPEPENHRPNIVITLTDDQIRSRPNATRSNRA